MDRETVNIEGLRINRTGSRVQVIVVIAGVDHKIWDEDSLFPNESINLHAVDIIRATQPQGDDNHAQMMARVRALAAKKEEAPNHYSAFFDSVVKFLEGQLERIRDSVKPDAKEQVTFSWYCEKCGYSGNLTIPGDTIRQSLTIDSLARAIMDMVEHSHFFQNGMQCIKKDFLLSWDEITPEKRINLLKAKYGDDAYFVQNPNYGFEPGMSNAVVSGTPHKDKGKAVVDILSDGKKLFVVDNKTELNAVCEVCGNHFHQSKADHIRTTQHYYPALCDLHKDRACAGGIMGCSGGETCTSDHK